jgi:hypothetical protein
MLERIRTPATRDAYLAFHRAHRAQALVTPAAVSAHHAFPGGYPIHIREVMSNLRVLVSSSEITNRRDLGFGADDAITAAYVHDLDKLLYRYELDPEKPTHPQIELARRLGINISPMETKATISEKIDATKTGRVVDDAQLPRHRYREAALEFEDGAIVCQLCWKHGLTLSDITLHAVCVHHGGWSPLARTTPRLQMQPLGALLHVADLLSSTVQRGEGDWNPQPVQPPVDDTPPPPPPDE